ncbi:fibroblast growth factor 4A [Embiotoca jacksoni]|uniref:fibroblast growth factor 4A n=1 Tax=Embiotoca jacksoni TaxID=100190 RepID=UPI0037039418
MCLTMSVSSLLLLLLTGSHVMVQAERQQVPVSRDDHGSLIRGLWKLHMRDTVLKRKGSSPHPIREGVKEQLLYCRVGIGYHLQMLPGGSMGGVHKPTEYCRLKVSALKHGVVGIRGVRSGLYLCLSGEGRAYGAEQFSDECMLKENLEENHYTTYSSVAHPGIYLALSHKGELRRGNSLSRHQACTHFLPRRTP